MSPLGLISFNLDIGSEGNRIIIAKESKTNQVIGKNPLHLPKFTGQNNNQQHPVYIYFKKSEFPNIKISDITFWQRTPSEDLANVKDKNDETQILATLWQRSVRGFPVDSKVEKEDQVLVSRIHDLAINTTF